MTDDRREGQRLRFTPLLAAAVAVQLAGIVLFLANVSAERVPRWLIWQPALASTVLTVVAFLRAAAVSAATEVLRRLWRRMAVVAVLVTAGLAGDVWQAVLEPAEFDGRQHYPVTYVLYVSAVVVLLWTLLQRPARRRDGHPWAVRFVLDALTVSITMGIFAWYFTAASPQPATRGVPMIILAAVALTGSLALVKIAMGTLGVLERGTIQLLASGAVAGGVGGSAIPLLFELQHGLNAAQITVPATSLLSVLAADRQRRFAGVPVPPRRRAPFSLAPYLAVAATDSLLLLVSHRAGDTVFTVALAAVTLTALVALRQINALADNARLLRRVDAGQAELAHRASHDDLTGLANRYLFEQRARSALAGDETLSLALIDLDDFKAINDRFGHAVGDALLVVVAERLRGCVPSGDVVARLGGDEFGLLLTGVRGGEATGLLARVTDALSRPVHALGYDLLIRASVGLSEAWPGAEPQELLRRADLAMYAAKERGKGRHAVYDAELDRHQADDARLGAELRRALDNSEFSLVYQPIVRLPDGRWTGVEALVRWHCPMHGFVGPDKFIPIAERTGLIVPLGNWILRTALRQAIEWDTAFGPVAPREIGINVSARQLAEPDFAARMRDALTETGIEPGRVVVEVTETAVFDGGVALDHLHDLVRLGVRVALDDFGTGHSSLGLLRTCPADILKVDKSFVDGIGGSSEEAVIATAMIQITDGLHLQAIAEGVENAEQAQTLHRLGYRYAQGYHFARPLSAAQVHEHLVTAGRPRSLVGRFGV